MRRAPTSRDFDARDWPMGLFGPQAHSLEEARAVHARAFSKSGGPELTFLGPKGRRADLNRRWPAPRWLNGVAHHGAYLTRPEFARG